MNFFVRCNDINVDLFTSRAGIYEHARPQKSSVFLPDWWKKISNTQYSNNLSLSPTHTIKTCPAFRELYNVGIIHPMWSDLNLRINPDHSYEYQYADGLSSIGHHQLFQHEGSPYSDKYTQVKLHSPWIAKSKSDVKWLFVDPYWNDQGIEDMNTSYGVMSFNQFPSPLHLNMFFKNKEEPFVYRIKYGTPMAHIIPLTEKRIKLHYHLVDDKELMNMQNHSSLFFFFSSRHRNSKKRCPHA